MNGDEDDLSDDTVMIDTLAMETLKFKLMIEEMVMTKYNDQTEWIES